MEAGKSAYGRMEKWKLIDLLVQMEEDKRRAEVRRDLRALRDLISQVQEGKERAQMRTHSHCHLLFVFAKRVCVAHYLCRRRSASVLQRLQVSTPEVLPT